MMKLLELRARLKIFYQKYQLIIDPVAKFILAFVAFHALNKSIGYDVRFTKGSVEFLLSLLCAFTPVSIMVLLSLVLTVVHVYAVSIVLTIFVLLIFIILYCFLFRYAPQYGYAAVAIPLLYGIKMPFAVPIYFGLMANPVTILPTACGVVIHYTFLIIKEEAMAMEQIGENTLNILEMDDALLVYTKVVDKLLSYKQMFLAITIFSLTIVIVYVVRSLKIEYSFEISVAAGAVTCILGFLIGYLRIGISSEIGSMIFGTLFSAAFVLLILLFKRTLDYTATESVQFEDDDYYYYVKAVPKIDVSIPKVNVKHINEKMIAKEEGYEEEEYKRPIHRRRETDHYATARSNDGLMEDFMDTEEHDINIRRDISSRGNSNKETIRANFAARNKRSFDRKN